MTDARTADTHATGIRFGEQFVIPDNKSKSSVYEVVGFENGEDGYLVVLHREPTADYVLGRQIEIPLNDLYALISNTDGDTDGDTGFLSEQIGQIENMVDRFTRLGKESYNISPEEAQVLDTFDAPDVPRLANINLTSDEVTAVCPATGQPDWYTVDVDYMPDRVCIESKSWKLYLQSFRNRGLFVEAMASEICRTVYEQTDAFRVAVNIRQKPRGGVEIVANAELNRDDLLDNDPCAVDQYDVRKAQS